MHRNRFTFGILLAGILVLSCMPASGQQSASISMPGAPQSAQGQLTVTATVVSSVGLVTGPDGELRMFVANAANPADNVSRLQMVRMVALIPQQTLKPSRKKKTAPQSR